MPTTTRTTRSLRHGSGTLSKPVSSRAVRSIQGQLSMFEDPISPGSISAISSRDSAAGAVRSGSPDSPMIVQSGPEAARASRSRLRAREAALPTSAISGPSGESLSPSDALQRSMESKLRALLNGSDLCEVIWKPWATPWGQSLSRPRARVRTIFGTDCGSWPTPTTRDHKDGRHCPNVPINGLLGRMVWPTPTSLAKAKDGNNEAGNSAGLVAIRKHAMAATWATPAAQEPGGTAEASLERKRRAQARGKSLGISVTNLSFQIQAPSNGSSEQTEKPGALNPEFVSWLMGYPPEWLSCAPSETPSTSGRLRPSSKQRCEP